MTLVNQDLFNIILIGNRCLSLTVHTFTQFLLAKLKLSNIIDALISEFMIPYVFKTETD